MFPQIQVEVPARLTRLFKREAKRVFPKEAFGYLLGDYEDAPRIRVRDLWLPPDIEAHATREMVLPPREWIEACLEYAEDHELDCLGSIHSHPYTKDELPARARVFSRPDHAQSEADIRGGYGSRLNGICCVVEGRDGVLRASVRFWGPMIRIEVQET